MKMTEDSGIQLRIAGVKPKFHKVFMRRRPVRVENQVRFYGYLSDNALRALYQKAKLFFMPSISEGFGIPVLEAMAIGCPCTQPRRILA